MVPGVPGRRRMCSRQKPVMADRQASAEQSGRAAMRSRVPVLRGAGWVRSESAACSRLQSNLPLMSSSRPQGRPGQWHARGREGLRGLPLGPHPHPTLEDPALGVVFPDCAPRCKAARTRDQGLQGARPSMPRVHAPGALQHKLGLNPHARPGKGSVSLCRCKDGLKGIKSLDQKHTARKLAIVRNPLRVVLLPISSLSKAPTGEALMP